jgi:ppGpp synthetase/RelA/SpoT-type nucleotidyltranferase
MCWETAFRVLSIKSKKRIKENPKEIRQERIKTVKTIAEKITYIL